jgi:glutamyl-tRNA(Gln) amidotransferase subunit E
MPLLERIVAVLPYSPAMVAKLFAHELKHLEGRYGKTGFQFEQISDLLNFLHHRDLDPAILKAILPVLYQHPKMEFNSILIQLQYEKADREKILSLVPSLTQIFKNICRTSRDEADIQWIMGNLRKLALGNMNLGELRSAVKSIVPERN